MKACIFLLTSPAKISELARFVFGNGIEKIENGVQTLVDAPKDFQVPASKIATTGLRWVGIDPDDEKRADGYLSMYQGR